VKAVALAITAFVALLAPGAVWADGGPVFNDSGGLRGVLAPSGYRYVTVDDGNIVLLQRIAPDLHVAAYRRLPGRYTISAVAMDRTTAGLSADGRTLVLVQPRFWWGRKHTKFLLMSLPGMHVQSAVTLHGDFTFDAMSPDSSRLYFIQYLSKNDPTRYQVRAFDTATARLIPGAIVDRTEPDEEMRGYPVSRVTSADGRYAYTLYDGGGGTPFVHVLDTVEGQARCVDLDALGGNNAIHSFRLRRAPDGDVAVALNGTPWLVVERTSFRVVEPAAEPSASNGGGGISWAPLGAGAVGLLAFVAISLLLIRRRRPAPA
jgi:hypothetical protein